MSDEELFCKLFPEYVVNGKPLSPYFDLFESGYEQSEKRIEDLEKENAELRKVAEFQQSSNMSRHFENKKLKEGLAVGSILNKGLNSLNKALEEERDKYRNMVFEQREHLTNAKEIIKKLYAVYYDPCVTESDLKYRDELFAEIKQFLSEVEK